MAHNITSRQCKQARSLLKWNPQDLASRTRIPVRNIERFEKGVTRLMLPENDEIMKTFKKNGIIFKDNFDVMLVGKDDAEERAEASLDECEPPELEADGTDINFDKPDADSAMEDENKMWVHTPEYTGPDRRTLKNQMYYSGPERRKDRQDLVQKVIQKHKK